MADRCQVPADSICWMPPYDLVCDPCLDLDQPEDLATFDQAWAVAAAYTYERSGRQWPGDCFVERVRPCLPICRCGCPQDCNCGTYTNLNLTEAGFCLPIVELLGVNIRGGECCPCNETTTLRPCDGRVRMEWFNGSHRLVRQSSSGCCPDWWPQQDLCRPDGDQCTWSIDVRTGCCPPPDVLAATAGLALEIVKECQASACTIPQGATSVTARGVTYQRDPDQIGSGFWMSMLSDTINHHDGYCAEQFCAPSWCETTEWHHVFGPCRFALVDCEVMPEPMLVTPFGVAVCGNTDCCGRTCGDGPPSCPAGGCDTGCGDGSCCCCDDATKAAVAEAVCAIMGPMVGATD